MAANPRIDELRKRLAADPGSRLFAQLAEELRKAGELAEAVAVCREGLQEHAGYASARMTLGRALMDGGELQEARGEFQAVLQGAPQNILAGRYLGECLEQLGESGAALARYRTTLLLAPGDDQLMARIRSLESGARGGSTPATQGPAGGVASVPAVGGPPGAAAGPGRPEGAVEAEPAAIPLVAAEEGFELESPLSAPGVSRSGEPRAAAGAATTGPLAAQPRAGAQAGSSDAGVASPRGAGEPGEGAKGTASGRAESGAEGGAEPAYDLEFDSIGLQEAPRTSPKTLPFEAGLEEMAARLSAPGPGDSVGGGEAGQGPLASTTLAELYLSQGLTEKAIGVYRELLEREPGNAQAKERLIELEGAGPPTGEAESPAPDPGLRRRRAIERTIQRLEGLLAALGRG